MTVRELSANRTAASRASARASLVAWAGFLAASATILMVAFG